MVADDLWWASDPVPGLIVKLKNLDPGFRKYAAAALGALQDKRAVPALLDALSCEHDGTVKIKIVEALGKIKHPCAFVAKLIKCLEHDHGKVRSSYARVLGAIGDASAVPALIETLKDEDYEVRLNAAWALGKIGHACAVPALIETLKDEDMTVRWSAGNALTLILGKSQTIEEIESVEKAIIEASGVLRKGQHNRTFRIEARLQLVKLLTQIAERKNELAPKRDLLLPDTIKAPKKGDVYNNMRRVRNG